MVGAGGRVVHWNGASLRVESALAKDGDLRGVWGSGEKDLWMVGGPTSTNQPTDPDGMTNGTLLHWVWNPLTQSWEIYSYDGVPALLRAVWGSSLQDVWAVGGSRDAAGVRRPLIVHARGAQVVPVPAPAGEYILTSVWGSGPSDVWAGGGVPLNQKLDGTGVLLHWDGSTWQRADVPVLRALITSLSGTGPADVWATADDGAVHRWDGKTWSRLDSGSGLSLNGVWGGTGGSPLAREVWVAGVTGSILRRHSD